MKHVDEGRRLTTNLSECINAVLKGTRRLPVARSSEPLMSASNTIEKSRKDLSKMRVTHCDRMASVFSVDELEELSGSFGCSFRVRLRQGTCDCGEFQSLHYPCRHAQPAAPPRARNGGSLWTRCIACTPFSVFTRQRSRQSLMRACGPSRMGPQSVRTQACAARRKDIPSPPALGTRWTWLSAPRRDAFCADRRGTPNVGVRTHPHGDQRAWSEEGHVESPRPGCPHELGDGADGMMCHMGADGDPFVAALPMGELSGEAMALERSGRKDHRAAAGGVKSVTHSDNTVVEATVCDS
ncbi:hypothetical protein PIB30_061945 [Stylosanthes scabra]|uniref:SWIM-type domain-containing protein n=1 Tax=Stylosanthes scabra TaxID=79078 RepID=A0ABU6WMN3_9FABA|nr:hypothetical protein [Stylosanthes scabra]